MTAFLAALCFNQKKSQIFRNQSFLKTNEKKGQTRCYNHPLFVKVGKLDDGYELMGRKNNLKGCGTGQIALPFILLISGIIIEITIAGAFITYFLSASGFGERLSFRAASAARSGIYDGIQRISRDKEYATSPQNYSFMVDKDTATVSISRIINAPANIYVYTILATGTAGSRQKKFIATATVDQTTGQLQFQSLVEVPVS